MKSFKITWKSGAFSFLLFVFALFLSAPAPVTAADKIGTQITFDGGSKGWGTNWSPNGKWIAYACYKPLIGLDIYIVSSKGGDPINLTTEIPGYCMFPRFTHDSKQVIFTYITDHFDIMSVDISQLFKKNPKTIPPSIVMPNAANGRWSHGGRYLAYTDLTTMKLMVYDNTKEKSWPIGDGQSLPVPCWSHNDSHVITALAGWFLYSIPREGGLAELLGNGVSTWNTDTSPDGRWVLCDKYGVDEGTELFAVDIDTQNVTPLFIGPNTVAYCPCFSPNGREFCYIGAPDWSDGKNIFVAEFNPSVAKLAQKAETVPTGFALFQNSPNPFNPTTTIQYSVPAGCAGNITLKVYDLRGALVRTLVEGIAQPGVYSVLWNGRDDGGKNVSSGMYIYRLQAGIFTESRKMLFMR